MFNKLIKTEEDYNLALSRIDALMDVTEDGPESDELELLVTLVEMYEEKHYPIDMPDPVEAIKFRMDQLGLNQQALVPIIGSRSKVSEILNRKRPLTLVMMRALHIDLGISADILLKEPRAKFPDSFPEIKWSRFPFAEMVKRGWIEKTKDIKTRAEELMRDFIGQAGGQEVISKAFFRKNSEARKNSKTDTYSLFAWCLRILSLASKNHFGKKYYNDLSAESMRDIAKLSYFKNGPLLAKEFLAKQGIYLIIEPHLPKTYLDGAAMLLQDGTPVIGLTLRYDRIDNFWFCLLHELGHVIKHLSKDEPNVFIDDFDLRGHEAEISDIKEHEADELAQDALIPPDIWEKNSSRIDATTSNVKALSEKLKIHPAIIAGRIRFERKNYRLLSQIVGNREIRKHFSELY
jgi:HTH-type transcriptional regulator / antitoxin HigA